MCWGIIKYDPFVCGTADYICLFFTERYWDKLRGIHKIAEAPMVCQIWSTFLSGQGLFFPWTVALPNQCRVSHLWGKTALQKMQVFFCRFYLLTSMNWPHFCWYCACLVMMFNYIAIDLFWKHWKCIQSEFWIYIFTNISSYHNVDMDWFLHLKGRS